MAGDHAATARPTPADPVPGLTIDESIPTTEGRKLPPELGPDAVAVVEGRTFMYSDGAGDVPAGTIGGLVHADSRLLNRWVLTINGARLLRLRSALTTHYSAAFYLTNPQLPGLHPNTIGVRRLRLLGRGLRERIELRSFAEDPIDVELRLSVGNDFADIFEIKDKVRDRSNQITREHAADPARLILRYRNRDYESATTVDTNPPATVIDGDDLVWRLDLTPGRAWQCELNVPLPIGPDEPVPPRRTFAGETAAGAEDPVNVWQSQVPHIYGDSPLLNEVVQSAMSDMLALRILASSGEEQIWLPAAGLPWFLSLFGRDTIVTAYQTLALGPVLARGALLALAHQQGQRCDDFRDEEPGKILHELRSGELTKLGIKPHSPYYGTADATPLWLVLLSEYWRWTRDEPFILSLRDNAMAALAWIDRYGDRDGDGYVEYQTRSPHGLGNQCWRDSWDGIQRSDGTIPVLPLATCEIQGYVYDAKLRMAELADGPFQEPGLAQRLRGEAADLRDRFNRDFWIEERGGYYALGLDGDKHQVDSLSSNIGHLLWSGIVPPERAPAVVDQLMSDTLFSGWGVRTTSTTDSGYNPIGYHRGTVWPHDNSIIAAGLTRYGYREQANRIATALLDAAPFFNHRLPEALSGYPRTDADFPIPYPTACSPQAWASGAPLLCLRSMLDLNARDGRVEISPHLPDQLGRVLLTGIYAFGKRWDIEANGTNGDVRLSKSAPPDA